MNQKLLILHNKLILSLIHIRIPGYHLSLFDPRKFESILICWHALWMKHHSIVIFATLASNNLNETCAPGKRDSVQCAFICSVISCCFGLPQEGHSGIDTNLSSASPAVSSSFSCYETFPETCDGYAQFCAPHPPTSVPSVAPSIILPPPPLDLELICASSADWCKNACSVASCCFEVSTELSCYANNKKLCDDYSPCIPWFFHASSIIWLQKERKLRKNLLHLKYIWVISS